MIKSFKKIFLSFIAFIAIASVLPKNSHAEYGATIAWANCNPGADPALDYQKTDSHLKSCIGQGIKMNDFKVRVDFDPSAGFVAAYTAVCDIFAKMTMGAAFFTPAGPTFVSTCAGLANTGGSVDILVGNTEGVGTSIIETDLAKFELRVEGDKACVYAKTPEPLLLNFKAERSDAFNVAYGISATSPLVIPGADGVTRTHCVYMPLAAAPVKPAVPSFISAACINYDASASQFKWPRGGQLDYSGSNEVGSPSYNPHYGQPMEPKTRAFTGIVVQCVEDTMMNLFFNKHNNATQSVFQKTQAQLLSFIRVLLVLYVMLLGFKYAMLEKGGLKQNEFIWISLKIGMVMYFAAGSGLTERLPDILASVKTLSSIIIDAGGGTTVDRNAVTEALNTNKTAYESAKNAYAVARMNWARYTPLTAPVPPKTIHDDPEKIRRKAVMDAAKTAQDNANSEYERSRLDALSFGYNYCNFTPFVLAGRYNVETEIENNATYPPGTYLSTRTSGSGESLKTYATRDMSHMKLWDSIDCRLAKYLGIGANPESPSTPQVLLLAVGSLLGGPIGLIVSCLVIVFLVFVILIILRMVHIYLMAFMALILLTYISPLIIPMILFEQAKSSFNSWLTQFIGYAVQPIILFAFLAFMFGMFDSIIYGGNYDFNPPNKADLIERPSLNDNTIARVQDRQGRWVCPDADTFGCMYEKIAVTLNKVQIEGATVFAYYTLKMKTTKTQQAYTAAGEPITTETSGNLSQSQYVRLMIEMMKLVFVCFIMHALLGQVEDMSAKLTNVGGMSGGAAGMSGVPTANPLKIAGATVIPALKGAGRAAGNAGKLALKHTAGKAAKGARRAELKSAKESK